MLLHIRNRCLLVSIKLQTVWPSHWSMALTACQTLILV